MGTRWLSVTEISHDSGLDSRDSGDGEVDGLEVFGGETDGVLGSGRGSGEREGSSRTLGFPVGAEWGTLSWAAA